MIQSLREHAFTLIETIIAMSLMTLLMAIVWTMFGVYTKLESKGVQIAKETSLVRSIDRQLRHDLLHVVSVHPAPNNVARIDVPLSELESLDPATENLTDGTVDPATTTQPTDGYFRGTATEMHFVVGVASTTTDGDDHWRVVSYQPHTASIESEDQLESANRELDLTPPLDQRDTSMGGDEQTPDGIDRYDRSWKSFWRSRPTDDSQAEILSTNRPIKLGADDFLQVGAVGSDDRSESQRLRFAPDTVDEIPEVRQLRFRFYDGRSWTDQWDSATDGGLPLAVEISFDLQMDYRDPLPDTTIELDRSHADPMTEPNSDTMTIGDDNSEDTSFFSQYRLVIALAAAAKSVPREGGDDTDAMIP